MVVISQVTVETVIEMIIVATDVVSEAKGVTKATGRKTTRPKIMRKIVALRSDHAEVSVVAVSEARKAQIKKTLIKVKILAINRPIRTKLTSHQNVIVIRRLIRTAKLVILGLAVA